MGGSMTDPHGAPLLQCSSLLWNPLSLLETTSTVESAVEGKAFTMKLVQQLHPSG